MHNEHELRRAKRQLELHIWKTVIASRHHANKMKELQKLADEMMVSPSSKNSKIRHSEKPAPSTRIETLHQQSQW